MKSIWMTPVLASILILGAFTVGYSFDDAFAKGNGQPKVTICHVDQDTGEEKTITISNKAVDKHIANHIGDHLGECVDEPEPVCGNGIIEPPETCDDGTFNGRATVCNTTCDGPTPPVCGNGITEPPETCDDGTFNGRATFCNTTCDGPT